MYGRSLEIPSLNWDVPGTSTGGIVLIGRYLIPSLSTRIYARSQYMVILVKEERQVSKFSIV